MQLKDKRMKTVLGVALAMSLGVLLFQNCGGGGSSGSGQLSINSTEEEDCADCEFVELPTPTPNPSATPCPTAPKKCEVQALFLTKSGDCGNPYCNVAVTNLISFDTCDLLTCKNQVKTVLLPYICQRTPDGDMIHYWKAGLHSETLWKFDNVNRGATERIQQRVDKECPISASNPVLTSSTLLQ